MLSKDYLRNRHSRLVQMSAQPHALSGSSRGQTCKETLLGYSSGSQHAPDFLSSAGLHGKATSESTGNAWECPKTRTGGHWGALKGWEKLPVHQHISLRHKLLRGKAAVTASQRLCMDSRGYTVLGDKPLGWMKSVLDHFAPRHLRSFVIPLFFLAALPTAPFLPATMSAGAETAQVLGSASFAQSLRNYH